ncbi:MAG TPA: bifunctional 4-hydroxy-3-methylbut-2-enyl diphosphate reductase/30S ribosomal protein S1 [Syntrophomonadaceae bacterium]|nr:bifunctional 4-hydroxy-3-methylbut-2-enyl diphosphate reductase/30S ribosomal protein S1 [Syntrophomonadaceae bacterium]
MQVRLAGNAGFCAGVKRAIKMAEETIKEPGLWYSLGPLVHNKAVVNYYQQQGLNPVDTLEEISQPGAGILIRTHGTTPEQIDQAQRRGILVKDATCTLVTRVHEIVALLREENYDIVIFGDRHHPEVQGILGWCGYRATVVGSLEEAKSVPGQKIALVSQTTRDEDEFFGIASALLARGRELRVFNTICSATRKRQEAARALCEEVDLMLVVGDPASSNTSTLVGECYRTGVPTIRIQTAGELNPEWFRGVSCVGLTAGASTPDWIIKEVMERMTQLEDEKENLENIEETVNHEDSFAKMEAEMADLASPAKGDIIKGTVIQVLDDEVMVDVGGKSEGIVPLREMTNGDVGSAKELVKVGDEIEVMVLKWDDDGNILLSKKKVDSQKVLDALEEDYKEGRTIEGTITGSVKGGLLVDVGVTAFLPASHVDDTYVKNLDDYIGKQLQFKIIEYNRNKRRGSQVVLSRKELVAQQKSLLKKEFWDKIEEGQTINGRIKRIVDYGAFIDLGGYEGLLHVSEIDHHRIEHPSNVFHEGDEVEVFILGLDREKERVSLSRKRLLKSPWEQLTGQYIEGDLIEGTVVRITPFGAFVELAPGVDGLVHISQLANRRVEKPEDVVTVGEKVTTKILNINHEEKKISLSIREAQAEQEKQEVDEFLDTQEES